MTHEALHTGEDHVRVGVLVTLEEQSERRVRPHPAEHVTGLAQDLLTVCDEQDTTGTRSCGVERRQPRLAETGRHHDQAGTEPRCPRRLQGVERLTLDRSRCRVHPFVGVLHRGPWWRPMSGGRPAGHGTLPIAVAGEPTLVERDGPAVLPQPLEALPQQRDLVGADVPLDPAREAAPAHVGAADEPDPLSVPRPPEDVRLRVEAQGRVTEDPDRE